MPGFNVATGSLRDEATTWIHCGTVMTQLSTDLQRLQITTTEAGRYEIFAPAYIELVKFVVQRCHEAGERMVGIHETLGSIITMYEAEEEKQRQNMLKHMPATK